MHTEYDLAANQVTVPIAAMTLAQVRQDRHYRYGGAGEINPVFKFHERSRALLFNALQRPVGTTGNRTRQSARPLTVASR